MTEEEKRQLAWDMQRRANLAQAEKLRLSKEAQSRRQSGVRKQGK